MIKKTAILLICFFTLYILAFTLICVSQAQEEIQEIEGKAKEFHRLQEEMLKKPDLVTPDSIYTTAELKAIYYQNLQMIQLLKEVRDILRAQLEKDKQE